MQGIGAVIGIEADFEVVGLAAMFFEEFADLEAEVAFHFEDESAGPPFPIGRAMGKDLFGKRVHAAAGLAGADGANTAMPVNRPRSGIASQCGCSTGPSRVA